jgi:hypothetical protein
VTRSLLALGVLFLATTSSVAQSPAEAGPGLAYSPPTPPTPPDPLGLVVRLVVMTAGLLALCGGVLYLNRRVHKPAAATDPTGRIQPEGTLVLDRNCAVHILRVDGQSVAVTTDATGLRSIVLLSEPFETALANADQPPPESGTNRAA